MSQRSSKNARTQKKMTGETKGMTRKGASSVKPSRQVATTVHLVSSKKASSSKGASNRGASANKRGQLMGGLFGNAEKKEAKRQERERRDKEMLASNIQLKQDPRYSTYRKIWWGFLGVGLAMTIVSWACMFVFPANPNNPGETMGLVSTVALVLAYIFIIAGFVFDWIKVRPMRRKAETAAAAMSDKKLAQFIEADYAAQEEKRAAAKARSPRSAEKTSVPEENKKR